jgi:hypothetical protein
MKMSRFLHKDEWQPFFQGLADTLHGRQTRVTITGPGFGDQVVAGTVAMVGITYEPKTNLLDICAEGMDHLIRNPQKIIIEESGGNLASIQVIDGEGMHQLISLCPAVGW